MPRLNGIFAIPELPKTIGATVDSAVELAGLGEECILLQEPRTERVISQIKALSRYLGYDDVVNAITTRYLAEDPPIHSVDPDNVEPQATVHWKKYIEALRPDLYALIQELNHNKGIVDEYSHMRWKVPSKWVSRSMAYRTIISRDSLEEIQVDREKRRQLGKHTVATLDTLLRLFR